MRKLAPILAALLAGSSSAQALTPAQFTTLFGGRQRPMLDTLGINATACYSVRLLRAGYKGPLINLRRSSDNATQNEYPLPNGRLNSAAISAWLGGSTAYVTQWYDQSGNGHHVTQSTAANQPEFLPTGGAHGGPAVFYPTGGGTDGLQASIALAQPAYFQFVLEPQSDGPYQFVMDGDADSTIIYTSGNGNGYYFFAGNVTSGSAISLNTWQVLGGLFNGASSSEFLDGTSTAVGNPGSASPGGLTIGNYGDGGIYNMQALYEEVVVLNFAPTSAQQNAMYRNEKAYFGTN